MTEPSYSVEEDAFNSPELNKNELEIKELIRNRLELASELREVIKRTKKPVENPEQKTIMGQKGAGPEETEPKKTKPEQTFDMYTTKGEVVTSEDISSFEISFNKRLESLNETSLAELQKSGDTFITSEQFSQMFSPLTLKSMQVMLTILKLKGFNLTSGWAKSNMREVNVENIIHSMPSSPYNFMNEPCYYKVLRDNKGTAIILNIKEPNGLNKAQGDCFSVTLLSENMGDNEGILQVTYTFNIDDKPQPHIKVKIVFKSGNDLHAIIVSEGQVLEIPKLTNIEESKRALEMLRSDLKEKKFSDIPREKIVNANAKTVISTRYAQLLRRAAYILRLDPDKLSIDMMSRLLHQNRNS